MTNPNPLNPYAPSQMVAVRVPADPLLAGRVSILGVVLTTFMGITLSGAAFGLTIAAFIAVPVVLVILCLSAPLIPFSKGWLPHQARNFSAICGLLSGSSPFIAADPGNPFVWLAATIPGLFGGLGTMLFLRLIRRARSRFTVDVPVSTLAEQSANNVT